MTEVTTPNPDTGENFPFQFKWSYGFKTLPEKYKDNWYYTAICIVCKTRWAIIDYLYADDPNWVCPDPNCQRARYFRETVEKFENVLRKSAETGC